MQPIMPRSVKVPGDNQVRCGSAYPTIMARSGDLIAFDPATQRAVWRFGFLRGSEAADAYGIHIETDRGFVWALAGFDGAIIEQWEGIALHLPNSFREVISA